MSRIADLAATIRDIRGAGISYGPDLTFPAIVRHRAPLYVALGTLCQRGEERGHHNNLGARILSSLRTIDEIGRRSRYAGWFR